MRRERKTPLFNLGYLILAIFTMLVIAFIWYERQHPTTCDDEMVFTPVPTYPW